MKDKDIQLLIDKYLDGATSPEEEKRLARELSRADVPLEWEAIKMMLGELAMGEAAYDEMMTNGLKSPIDYERTKDKNGRLVNVDAELNAVKYYAHLSDNGYDMIFICSDTANIYVLFYNSEEIVYYTNDKNYSSTMPASFQAVAKAKNIKPTFR